MCSTNNNGATAATATMLPYGLKIPNPTSYIPFGGSVTQMTLDLHRAQLYDYSTRLQYASLRGYPNALGFSPYHHHPADPYGIHPYLYKDPRARYIHEEPKPNHSYIGLIAMGIISHRDKKMVLSDIYQYILDNYAYFRTRGPGWRNSIRHNLSLNDCFIKSGRSANGKGHYWAIHPANLDDFQKGDFRRRRAQRRVRKHMGLSVPDDDDSPTPSPSPSSTSVSWGGERVEDGLKSNDENIDAVESSVDLDNCETVNVSDSTSNVTSDTNTSVSIAPASTTTTETGGTKRRLFDVESLLAPETKSNARSSHHHHHHHPYHHQQHYQQHSSEKSVSSCKTDRNDDGDIDVESESMYRDNSKDGRSEMLDSSYDSDSTTKDHIHSTSDTPSPRPPSTSDAKSRSPAAMDEHQSQVVHSGRSVHHPLSDLQLGRSPRLSAFHSTGQCGWGNLPSYMAAYPLAVSVNGQYPLVVPTSMTLDTAQRWQETVSQLVTNSYGKQVRVDE